MTAILLCGPDTPESEWLKLRRGGIGASEAAAVLGISRFDSPFSLYWRKVNGWEVADNGDMEAGRRVEPVIADWFADVADPLDNLVLTRAGLYQSAERPWQLATPDRLIHMVCPDCGGSGFERNHYPRIACLACGMTGVGSLPLAVLECKHPYDWEGFGEPGTEQIPVDYRAQVLQQCDVLEVDEWYLAAYAQHEFRVYRGRRHDGDIRIIRDAGRKFWARIEAGDPPGVDDLPGTMPILRRLYSEVEDRKQEVPADVAAGFRRAKTFAARARDVDAKYSTLMRHHMGTARIATCDGKVVASRTATDQLRKS